MSEKSSLLSNCNPRKFFTIRLYVFSWVESNANRLYNVIKTFLIKSGLYKLLCRWKWNWNFKVSLEGSRKFYFLFHLKIAQPLDREEKLTFSGCRFKLLHGFTTRNHLSDLRLIWKNPSLKADTRYASAESQKWKGQFHEPFAFRQKTDPLNRSFRRRTHSLLLRLRQHTPHPLLTSGHRVVCNTSPPQTAKARLQDCRHNGPAECSPNQGQMRLQRDS